MVLYQLEQGTPPTYDPVVLTPTYKESVDDIQKDDSHLPQSTRGCSIAMLVLLSLPRMATNMAWAAQWAALGPYLGTMLPRYAVQLTQVIGPLSGILVAPTVGVLSDQSTCQWGRRRPFLFYGAITSVICWILMSYTPQIGEFLGDKGENNRLWTGVLAVCFYTWMDITVNVVQTPAFLLIADFAGERQTLGAGIGQASSTLGSILVAGYIYCFGAPYLTLSWFLGMLSVMMLTTVGAVCIFATEAPLPTANYQKSSTCGSLFAAFKSVLHGLRLLPRVLVVYCIVLFSIQYGYTAYNGSKGQFFGIEVYGGNATDADTCSSHCTIDQHRYNQGVKIAGGLTDLLFNVVGYMYSWLLPVFIYRFGAKWVVTIASIPQALLMVMAFTKSVNVDVVIVILTSITQATVFALIVPVIIHVFGEGVDVGMYVGAVNSANCFGQLLNFVVGAALVETSFGYTLPVFVGGAFSFLSVIISLCFFKIEMYSM